MDKKTPLILAVDDELMNLELLSFIIQKIDLHFVGVQKSTEALSAIKNKQPDLILLDVTMPEINGFELCQLIKEDKDLNDIPIIFVTGKQKVEHKVKGLQLGGVDYVTKPYNEHELRARIQTHLELASAKQQIEDQAQKLAKDNALLNQMFSIIGHDLRSPLSAIKMQLDFILRGIIDPKAEDFTSTTIQSLSLTSSEAFNLLDNLLGWAKSETGVLTTLKEEVNLKNLLAQTARLQQLGFTNKHISFQQEIPEHAMVLADFNMLKTLLVNLVSNAIKFTPKKGTISVTAEETPTHWKILVTDSGVGMGMSQLKKVLDPDIHFSKKGTEEEAGTGLGLVLCQDFLQKNDSQLQIESKKGKGSTFSFSLAKA